MDQTLLLNVDIALGREAIADYENWRLVVAARKLDAESPRRRYEIVNEATDRAGRSIQRSPDIPVLKTNEPFIRELRAWVNLR